MSSHFAVSVPQRAFGFTRSVVRRVGVAAVVLGGTLVSTAATASAQAPTSQEPTWEVRFTSGAFVPTGSERNSLKDAQMSAAQVSWLVSPSFAVTGTLGWARSRDIATTDDPKLDVFSYDLGVEARAPELFAGRTMTLAPFAGVGAGARSYNYRNLDIDATHNLAGYATAGGELGVRRVGLRLEVRDYMTGFRPLVGGGSSTTRNDVVVMLGLRLRKGV